MGTCRSITAALLVAESLGATALPSIAQSVEEEVAADPERLGQNTAFLQAQGCCAKEFSDRSELLTFAYWSGEFLFENWATAVHDLDGNGYLDFFANHHYGFPSEFIMNFGSGAPTHVPFAVASDRHGAVFFDIDQDGDADLIEAVGGGSDTATDPAASKYWNLVFKNVGGQFRTRNLAPKFGIDYGPSRTRLLVPVNFDGQIALYNASEPKSDGTWPSTFFWMNGDGTYGQETPTPEIAAGVMALGFHIGADAKVDFLVAQTHSLQLHENAGAGFAVTAFDASEFVARITEVGVADFDGDLVPEVFVGQTDGQQNKLFRKSAEGWSDVAEASRLTMADNATAGTTIGDFDNDGDLDIAALQDALGVQVVFWTNDGSGRFTASSYADKSVQGRGEFIISGDFNRDGALDLVATTSGGRTGKPQAGEYVLLEGAAPTENWLSVGLQGVASETGGLGARVFVTPPSGATRMLEQDSGAHVYSQDSTDLHFGLGAAARATVRVVWPDGHEQVIADVAANQHVVITENVSAPTTMVGSVRPTR